MGAQCEELPPLPQLRPLIPITSTASMKMPPRYMCGWCNFEMVQSEALICLDAKHPDLVGALTEDLPLECIMCFNYAKVVKVPLREWKQMCKKLWRHRKIGQKQGLGIFQQRSRNKAWAACKEEREELHANFPSLTKKRFRMLAPVQVFYETM